VDEVGLQVLVDDEVVLLVDEVALLVDDN